MKRLLSVLMCSSLLAGCNFLVGETTTKEDPNEFVDVLNEMIASADVHSTLETFPKEIRDVTDIKEFKYMQRSGFFGSDDFIYVQIEYDIEGYFKEIQRLDDVSITFKNNESKYLVNIEEGNYYVAIYQQTSNTFEYAKYFEDEYRITYIFNQYFDDDEIKIDEKNKIDFSLMEDYLTDYNHSYYMYYFYVDNVGYGPDDEIGETIIPV